MTTDLILVCILIFLVWRGATRGFLRSLLGPLAFVVATAAAIYYFTSTKNIPIALGIGLLGPFILNWILRMFVQTLGDLKEPSVLSRVMGAVITVLWGLFIILPIVFALTLLPPMMTGISTMTKDIQHSCTFIVAKPVGKLLNLPSLAPAPKNPATASTPATSSALESLSQDARMQAILNDPTITKAIESKDYSALLSNPKIMAIAQDPALLQKLLSAAGELQQTNQ